MSLPTETTPTPNSANSGPEPLVVYDKGSNPSDVISPAEAARTMQELGVSDQGISEAAIVLDPKNRLLNYGTHYSHKQAQLRFRNTPELRDVKGEVVRLSTTVRGKSRTGEQMNRKLVHELEHLAQHDRHDSKVTTGHIAIRGLALAGAIIGSRIGKSNLSKTVGATVGGFLGYQAGYLVAPNERQALKRERSVISRAVSRG